MRGVADNSLGTITLDQLEVMRLKVVVARLTGSLKFLTDSRSGLLEPDSEQTQEAHAYCPDDPALCDLAAYRWAVETLATLR
jgi:hypothetical protein